MSFKLTILDFAANSSWHQERTICDLPLAKAWRIAEHYRRKALRMNDYKAQSRHDNWGFSVTGPAGRAYMTIRLDA